MDLPLNRFKRAILEGRQQIGLWSSLASNITVEVIAGAGFDWLLLDTEHSPNEVPMVLGQLQACVEAGAHPVVRPAWNDPVLIKRLLDMGTQSFLVPYIENEAQARQAVAATRYPPKGLRGYASTSRSSRYGRIKDYHTRAEAEICVLLQIESQAGLDNLEAITNVEGVDGIFVGPGDLGAELGFLGQPGHPDLQPVIEQALGRVRACGKPAGILTGDERLARRYIEQGSLFTAVGADVGILARGSEQLAARFKA